MPKKFTVVQNLAELLDLYRNTPQLFYDETCNPDPNGSFIRLADGKLSRVKAISDNCAEPGTRSGQR
jgi:hypothetical protein